MNNFFGPVLFLILMIIMFILVPKERIKRFTMLGLVGGLGIALLLVALLQNLWGFWVFHRVDLIYIFRIPLFLTAAWNPLEIIFAHLLIENRQLTALFIIALPLSAVLVHYYLLLQGLLRYSHWNLFLTFLVSLAIHLGIALYLYMSNTLINRAHHS